MKVQVYELDGVVPVVDPTAYVHPTAVLIGDVFVGAGCYIGPTAVLRGDFGPIEVRAGANIQDGCILHAFPGIGTLVEEDGHVGHGAVLHSCTIHRNALVGMNAVVNDNARVGDSAIVAAMAFVKAEFVVPPRSLAAGMPARVLRELSETELAWKIEGTRQYQALAKLCLTSMRTVEPLRERPAVRGRIDLPSMDPLSVTKARLAGRS
jgi:phenylacetic acid degradation protein